MLRYASRVARLLRGDRPAGYALIQADVRATTVSGRLWWRRWGPTRDELVVWTLVDDRFSDDYVWGPDVVFESTQSWDRGAFEHQGETLVAQWLDDHEAATVRTSVFGV